MTNKTRITWNTEDLARIIGTSKGSVRKMISSGVIRTALSATRMFTDIEAARTRVANLRYSKFYSEPEQ